MTDIFDGDPLIIIGANGADFDFKGGQPAMDQGFINHVNIGLLTEPGWCGNDIEPIAERKVGSQYIGKVKEPITRQSLLDSSKAAESDLQGDEFGKITPITTNPESQHVRTDILLQPPSNEAFVLRLLRTGQNWLSQKLNPINDRAGF